MADVESVVPLRPGTVILAVAQESVSEHQLNGYLFFASAGAVEGFAV